MKAEVSGSFLRVFEICPMKLTCSLVLLFDYFFTYFLFSDHISSLVPGLRCNRTKCSNRSVPVDAKMEPSNQITQRRLSIESVSDRGQNFKAEQNKIKPR